AHELDECRNTCGGVALAPAPFEVIGGIGEKRDCHAFRNGTQNAPVRQDAYPHAGFEPPLSSLSSACTIIRTTSGMVKVDSHPSTLYAFRASPLLHMMSEGRCSSGS